MEKFRAHVVKLPTKHSDIFPYSHFNDKYHDPYLQIGKNGNGNLSIDCIDVFKMKPNFQMNPKNRVDIYIPIYSAKAIGTYISKLFGDGILADISNSNPELSRIGPQTLPIIIETRTVKYQKLECNVVGHNISGQNNNIYIDIESPEKNHIEMKETEIHLGMNFNTIQGQTNFSLYRYVEIPDEELKRNNGEKNPIAIGQLYLTIELDPENARNLASTLLYYASKH